MLLMGYGENIWGQEKPAAIKKARAMKKTRAGRRVPVARGGGLA
jgi:hypothetical protein